MTRVIACGGLTIDWLQDASGRHGPSLGGNAAYAAVGAWLAGADAEVVAVIGDDYPPELIDGLTDAGIGVGGVLTSPGPSFRVLLDESGPRREISYLPGSGHNDRLDPVPAQLPSLHAGDGVHICPIPIHSQRALLDALAGHDGVTTLDSVVIGGEIEPQTDELLEVARRVSAFLPSREEVDHHWPGAGGHALDQLADAGCERVIVKLGQDGSIGRDGSGVVRVPAAEATVVDPTGAGDAYCGAVCARLAMGATLGEAMTWGSAAASVVIEGLGTGHALSEEGRRRAAGRADRLAATISTGSPA